MEFNGTFNLKLINRIKGETMRQSFRAQMKVIYLGACAAYIAEIARQVPVLTGASRSALLWRVIEIINAAKTVDASTTSRLGISNLSTQINLTNTLAKQTAHSYPSPGWTPSREKWKQTLLASGQTADSWMSDTYVPMIIDVGVGNQYMGRYKFHFEIKDFYLEHYDAGTINSSEWSFGEEYPYGVGPWNLHQDGQQVFNEIFEKLMKTSGVLGLRAVLPGIPIGAPEQYLEQVEAVGALGEEEVPF
jgi:hypothetical protein